jgi:hypothetical protein
VISLNMDSYNSKSIGFSVFALFGLYLILYNPILRIANLGLFKPLMIIGVMVLIVRYLNNAEFGISFTQLTRLKVPRVPVLLVLYLGLVLCLGQLIASFGGGDDNFFNLFSTIFFTLLPLTYSIVLFLPKSCNPVLSIIAMTALIGALQSLLIILSFLVPSVSSFFSSILSQPITNTIGMSDSLRATGLTSLAGDGLSFAQSICGICALYLLMVRTESKSRVLWSACFAIILLSLIPVARTGFVILALSFFIFLMFAEGGLKSRMGPLLMLLNTVMFTVALLAFLLFMFYPDMLLVISNVILPYAFEFLFSYFNGDGFSSESTKDLATMIIFPNHMSTWLFGDGYFSTKVVDDVFNYMGTDIGYLRILFYIGLVGSLFLYSWFLIVAYVCMSRKYYKSYRIFFLAFFISIFVANIKFPFVLQNLAICFSLLFLFSVYRKQGDHS